MPNTALTTFHDPSLSIPPPPAHVPTQDARPAGCKPHTTDAGIPAVAFDRDALLLLEAQGYPLDDAEHAIAYPATVAARPNWFLRAVDGFIGRAVRETPPIPMQTWLGACGALGVLGLVAAVMWWMS